jgi:hypothetical protein
MKQQFERRQQLVDLDPVTAQIMGGMEHSQARRSMSKAQREKDSRKEAKRRKEQERNEKRTRWNLDIPRQIKGMIAALAVSHDVSESQLMALAAARLVDDLEGGLDINRFLEPSDSPKFSQRIRLPEKWEDAE